MTRLLIGIASGALVGGLLGYFQVFCPDGQCQITGSWYGGAVIGGLVGAVLTGGCPCCAGACRTKGKPKAGTSAEPTDADNPYRSE